MDYYDAKRRVAKKRIAGTALALVGGVFSLADLLLYMYSVTRNGGPLLSHLYQSVQSLIVNIYGYTQRLTIVWRHASVPDPRAPLSHGSIGFFIFYALIFIGVSLVRSGNKLARRIAHIDLEIEDELMRASVRGEAKRTREQLQDAAVLPKQSFLKELHTLYIAPLVVGVILWLLTKL